MNYALHSFVDVLRSCVDRNPAVHTGRVQRRRLGACAALLIGVVTPLHAAASAAASIDDPIFHSAFELSDMPPMCITTVPITAIFTNKDPSDFFSAAWQQSHYGDACPAPHEMLAFNNTSCTEQPGHTPPRYFCHATACCGTPPPPSPCDQSAEQGLPAGALDIEPAVDLEENRGSLAALYPDHDTRTDAFHGELNCQPSIGEEPLPAEVDAPPTSQEVAAEASLDQFEQGAGAALAQGVTAALPANALAPTLVSPGYCEKKFNAAWDQVPCESLLHADQPFDGRDIIYVHGLATGQLENWLGNYAPAHKRWPKDRDEFLLPGGYFRTYAEEYWRDHIREHLSAPDASNDPMTGWQWWADDATPRYRPKQNRFLLVAWSSNQTLDYAQNAFLVQVSNAIKFGTNVVKPTSFPSGERRPFCANGCVVISHSTGGLLVSSALGVAKRGDYGAAGRALTDHLRVHVAFEGAISGSRLATIMLAVQRMLPNPGRDHLCTIVANVVGNNTLCSSIDTNFLQQSVLRDLMPTVAQRVWGPVLSLSPVPTLTVAGANPVGNFFSLTKPLLPGLDDGVVSANSACGNPNPVFPRLNAPSGVVVSPLRKAFDLGDVTTRAVKNFISQKHLMQSPHPGGVNYLAGFCTPYLSASGMVLPVSDALAGTPWDTRARYPNHYSLIQSMADHSYDGGGDDNNPWPSALGQSADVVRHYKSSGWDNREESSAVTNPAIFQRFADGSYLVKPQFADSVQLVRGRAIKFRLFRRTRYIWLWKRTYERLNRWESKQSSHYVYEYVARH